MQHSKTSTVNSNIAGQKNAKTRELNCQLKNYIKYTSSLVACRGSDLKGGSEQGSNDFFIYHSEKTTPKGARDDQFC